MSHYSLTMRNWRVLLSRYTCNHYLVIPQPSLQRYSWYPSAYNIWKAKSLNKFRLYFCSYASRGCHRASSTCMSATTENKKSSNFIYLDLIPLIEQLNTDSWIDRPTITSTRTWSLSNNAKPKSGTTPYFVTGTQAVPAPQVCFCWEASDGGAKQEPWGAQQNGTDSEAGKTIQKSPLLTLPNTWQSEYFE